MKRYAIGVIATLLLGGGVAPAHAAAADKDSKRTIEYLLDYVARSDLSFIRNGRSHTAKEAAVHMKAKYDHFKQEIKTPEDFIRLAASESTMSGQPYLVKTKDGKEIKCADWLRKILDGYRASPKKSAGTRTPPTS